MSTKFWDKFDKEFHLAFRDINQVFSPTPYNSYDVKRSDEIAKQIIHNYDNSSTYFNKEKAFSDLLIGALNKMNFIGCGMHVGDAVSILNGLEYESLNQCSISQFITNSCVWENNGKLSKRAVSVYVPEVLDEASEVFMLHEITHILKERNGSECKSTYTLMELIPMLLEMISAYECGDSNLFKEVLCERKSLLYYEAICYNQIKDELLVEHSLEEKEALRTALGMKIVYLNSFYYALAMFNYYLYNKDYVIDLVNAVLGGCLTTFEMLDKFILRGDYFSLTREYECGMSIFKKFNK